MTTLRRVLVLLAPVVLVVATAPAATAGGANVTTAIAVSHLLKPTSFQLDWKIQSVEGPLSTVSIANATSVGCEGCRSLGVAVGITLLDHPLVINQHARATTKTVNCVACTTVADAHSFVLGSFAGTPHLTQDGNNALGSVQEQLRALGTSALHADALRTSIDAILGQIEAILLDPSSYYIEPSTSETNRASPPSSAYVARRDGSTSSTAPNEQKIATDRG